MSPEKNYYVLGKKEVFIIVMKVKHWIVPLVALVLLASLLLSACGDSSSTTTPATTQPTTTAPATTPSETTPPTTTPAANEPQAGGTLKIIWSGPPATPFGWAPRIYGGEGFAAEPVLEGLLEETFDARQVPRLATSWDVADDGRSVIFHLREGVKFHDGSDLTAEVVKFNLDAYINAKRFSANVLSVDVIDPLTVRVNLGEWDNTIFTAIGSVQIASQKAVEENGEEWACWNAVGTGPFKQVSYEPDVRIRMERFDDYWGGKPYLDAIEGEFIVDTLTQSMALQSGQGDVLHSRQTKVIYDLQQAGFKVLHIYSGMYGAHPSSRIADSPWANLKVREALEYAINKQAIVDAKGYGLWEVAYQFPVEGNMGYVPDITPRTYNPEKARELLAEAGYPNGFTTKLIAANTDDRDMIVAVQADLADVGITAELELIDMAKWGEIRQTGWNGLFLAGCGIIGNYVRALDLYFREGSTEMYGLARPEGLTEAVKAASSTREVDLELVHAAARLLIDNVMWVPIQHHGDTFAYSEKVHGLNFGTYSQWGSFDAEKVWISK